MKIYKSPRTSYDVVGVKTPTDNMEVKWRGIMSGEQTGTIISDKLSLQYDETGQHTVQVLSVAGTVESKSGDSGVPVYVVDDSGKAHFVGIISGHETDPAITLTYITPWVEIQEHLGLKPIS